ncbi:hypothetical protein KCU83_g9099, partial [Aureobasidium melanogenum]
MSLITVNGNTLDPQEHLSQDCKGCNFIYIQGYDDLEIEQKLQLAEMHVEIQEYIAQYTYLCRYMPEDLEKIRSLPFVRTVNIFHPELKATVSLKDMVRREIDRTDYEVDLVLHETPNVPPVGLAPYVAQIAGVQMEQLEILPNKIRLTVHQDKLDNLAALDSINRIEEVRSKELYNDKARTILQIDTISSLDKHQGAGQIICVADTGFDQGLEDDTTEHKIHPAFKGRIERLVSFWNTNARDPVGHGTHVCGSICGSGTYKDSGGQAITIKGTAPGAKLMVQSMSVWSDQRKRWKLEPPSDLSSLFEVPYSMGVRIHNNSWGDKWDPKTGQLGYDQDATTIDRFIHEKQDFVILIAAGNHAREENAGLSQIGDNSAAKNCITVGACGSTRPNDGDRFDPQEYPTKTEALSADTAPFSSRGPTKPGRGPQGQIIFPGRIKPDVVAPGVAVLSAASRVVAEDAQVRVSWGQSSDNDWLFMSGTSMATPLVAGCVAVIREALQKKGKQHPSAALVKALLINGTINHASNADPPFDNEQGFGRVDIRNSVAMIESSALSGFIEGGSKLEGNTSYDVPALREIPHAARIWESQAITIPDGRYTLIATLVYPDPPGERLQNNVNLIVRAGDDERFGNMGSEPGFDRSSEFGSPQVFT